MPPRSSLTGSFSVTDANNEVVCPLKNNDGSNCRKRCFGEKRYRSMQEHIRRAHPDYYISKLPATEESFLLMVNTPLSERPPTQQPTSTSAPQGLENNVFYNQAVSSPPTTRPPHDFRRGSLPAASAAAALAQLHNSRPPEQDWDGEQDVFGEADHDNYSFGNYFAHPDSQDMFGDGGNLADTSQAPSRDLLSASFPPGRSTSLQPFPRPKHNRPRKSSVTENARRPKHERDRSKDQKRLSHERKAFSAEPSAAAVRGGRWEDLLDAAASATEEDSRDLTPIPQSPRSSMPPFQGSSGGHQFHSYTASPLQNAILPQTTDDSSPTFESAHLEPFPSVESSYDPQSQHPPYQHHHQSSNESATSNPFPAFNPKPPQQHPTTGISQPTTGRHHSSHPSGSNFHMSLEGLSTSPQQARQHQQSDPQHPPASMARPFLPPPQPYTHPPHTQAASPPTVQHYCAACHRIAPLQSSYACTECICGICRECVDVLIGMGPERGARCPRCQTVGGRFKPFMLDLR